jgi:hypothetical protein
MRLEALERGTRALLDELMRVQAEAKTGFRHVDLTRDDDRRLLDLVTSQQSTCLRDHP